MAKRSRRARKQGTDKVTPVETSPAPALTTAAPRQKTEEERTVSSPSLRQQAVDFAEEYYYVYTDMRNVTIVALIMFVLMIGMGYFV
jgi:hypothetical protein